MIEVRCPACGEVQSVTGSQGCTSCGWLVFEPRPGPVIVIAHDNRDVAHLIGTVLQKAGFTAHPAPSDRVVENVVNAAGLILDVGLTGQLMAFQLVETIRAEEHDLVLPIVLVASVYNKAAYKRRPTDLYGADDYVEQHEIADLLPRKLCSLLGLDPSGVSLLMSPAETSSVNVRLAGSHHGKADPVTKAAYDVVADLALYHQREFEHVAAGGDATSVESVLQEGSRTLARLAGITEDSAVAPVRDAFTALVSDLRRDRK